MLESLFNKVAGLKAWILLKRGSNTGVFLRIFQKNLRTCILKNICKRLFWHSKCFWQLLIWLFWCHVREFFKNQIFERPQEDLNSGSFSCNIKVIFRTWKKVKVPATLKTVIDLFKVNHGNTGATDEICLNLTMNTPELRYWRRVGVFFNNFEQISHIVLMFLLLNLKILEYNIIKIRKPCPKKNYWSIF